MLRSQILLCLLAPDGAPAGGVDTLPENEFQRTVLRGVESVSQRQTGFDSQIKKVLDDLDRSDREVKKALEELTQVKNHCNDFTLFMRKMEQVQRSIALNARSSFGDPVKRALANPETAFYLNAIARYCHFVKAGEGHRIDPAFRKVVEEGTAQIKALTGVDSSLGQATVPQQTFDEIYDTLLEYGQWGTLGVMRVGMRTTVLPVATARPQFYWIGAQTGGTGEGSQITSGQFTGGQVLLIIQTLAALMYVARELLADSTVDLAPYVLREMGQAVAWGMDTAAFIATGNADQTNAGYVGIFNAASANTQLAAVAAQGNTQVSGLALGDFVNCLLTVNPIVLTRPAKWWMHPYILAQMVQITDKMGRPLFQTFTEVPRPGGIGSILGYPVIPVAIGPTPTIGAQNGQPVAVFGDPEGQTVGIRSDLEIATSDDIGFPQNLRAFRTLLRAGVKLKTLPANANLKPFAVLTTSLT